MTSSKTAPTNDFGPLPMVLRSNPDPRYVELWNKNPKLFWRAYWKDKTAEKGLAGKDNLDDFDLP